MNRPPLHPEDAKTTQETADMLRDCGLVVSEDNTHVVAGLPVRAEIGIGGDVVFDVIVRRGDKARLQRLLEFLRDDFHVEQVF